MRRWFLLVSASLLAAGCSRVEDDGSTTSGDSESEALLAAFLAAEGQDIESCFEGLPVLDREPANEQFTPREGLAGAAGAGQVVMAVDASGSMAGRVGGETKMAAAKDAARSFLSGLPERVSVGLIAFGHEGTNDDAGKARSCRAVELLYPVGAAERGRIEAALGEFDATGWTPLAAAIRTAGASFVDGPEGQRVVYVVSDGEETCDGDPVAAARALHEGDVQAIVNIIGFDLEPADRAQLREVASAGGGSFVEVSSGDELRRRAAEARHFLRNAGALARSTVGNSGAMARNNVASSGAIARTNTCVSGAIARENARLVGYLADRGKRDRIGPVRELLGERHDRYRERKERYARIVRSRHESANEVLREDRERAREDYERVMEE